MAKQPVRTSVSDFVKGTAGSQFVIPVYQRNYTWIPEKETTRFMNDMHAILIGKAGAHFLGIIIYIESKISTMFQQLQVVDGQQRLTTVFIFLLALKRVAEEKGDVNLAGFISDYYLYNRHASERESLRLKPIVSSDDVYAKLVYSGIGSLAAAEKESSVYRNYEYIRKTIQHWSRKHALQEILSCLVKLEILAFPLSDFDNAQQIFESINSTGSPLTAADLIRNFVLMNHSDEVQERYYKFFWEPMEKIYPESRRLEDYFRYFLATKTYELLNRKDVYEGFKNYWQNSQLSDEDKFQEINTYCRYYHEIFEGNVADKEIEHALYHFRKNDTRSTAPIMIEMYHQYDCGNISKKVLIQFVELFDSYLMRRALVVNDTSSLGRYFPTLLRTIMHTNIRRGDDLLSILKLHLISYNRGKSLAMPTNEEIRIRLREVNAYSLMCIRPLLERIEHYGATARVDTSDLNIEHIMPQNANAYWKKNALTTSEDEYTFYANLIGNLTLCAQIDNVSMANHDFMTKKKILSKTLHIRMNVGILKSNTWNKNTILKRCDELAEQIIQIYPYYEENKQKQTIQKSKVIQNVVVLTAPTVSARAIVHSATDIEILPGTTMKMYGMREMRTMKELFSEMSNRGVLNIDENQRVQFAQSWHFKNLNDAAQFLMHRGGENTNAWKTEDGKTIDIKSLFEKAAEVKTRNNRKVKDDKKVQRTLKRSKPNVKKNTKKKVIKESKTVQKAQNKKSQTTKCYRDKRNMNGIQPQEISAYQEQKSANPFYRPTVDTKH